MRNPFYGFIAFLIAEGLIAFGFINREQSPVVQEQIETIVFYGSLMVTALLGFVKYLDAHKHQVTKDAQIKMDDTPARPVVNTPPSPFVKTDTTSQVEPAVVDPGTPPPGN